jgi:hypothetical protein
MYMPARLANQIYSPTDRAIERTEGVGDDHDARVQLLADCQHLLRGLGHSARGEDEENGKEGQTSSCATRSVHRLVPAKRAAHAHGGCGTARDIHWAEHGPCTPAGEELRQIYQGGCAAACSAAPRGRPAAGGRAHAGGGRATEPNTPRTSRAGISGLHGGRGQGVEVYGVSGCVGAAREVGDGGRRFPLAAPRICSATRVRPEISVQAGTHAGCTGRRSRRRARGVLELDERHGERQGMMTMWRCSTLDLSVKNVT